jgi:tetratricopeptide (TPR) repeat protein
MRHPLRTTLIASALALALPFLTACESNVQKYREQGVKLYQHNDYDQSLATLNKALSYDQFDAVSNTYAGLIQYRAGHYEQASYHFKVALQSDPSSNEAKDGLTLALVKLDKPDLALDYLERASAMADKVKDPREEKSNSKRRYMKQTEEALYVGKTGDRLRIGHAYEALGDFDNALVYYKKALALDRNNPRTLMAIAALYEKGNNKDGTREYLTRAYKVDPATPGLTDALTRNGIPISEIIGGPGPHTPPAK